jgi:epoxyqueuosine reductase
MNLKTSSSEDLCSWKEIAKIIEKYGFFFIGISDLRQDPEFPLFKQWLDEGRNGSMKYLEKNLQIREFPKNIDSKFKHAIIIGLRYGKRESIPRSGDPPKIAQYARYQDYHKVFRKSGSLILKEIHERCSDPQALGRVVCDSAPVLVRSLAVQTGGVFRGKNTCVISNKIGSLFFLGELFTSAPLPEFKKDFTDTDTSNKKASCGSCRRCQVHCPTGALDKDYRIDARKCIAYWTIEHRGTIPENYWRAVSNSLFGCDICQVVCPFNRPDATLTKNAADQISPLKPRELPSDPFKIATMSQEEYEAWFGGTPATRAKKEGLMRNALISLRVKDPHLFAKAASYLEVDSNLSGLLKDTIDQGRRIVFSDGG